MNIRAIITFIVTLVVGGSTVGASITMLPDSMNSPTMRNLWLMRDGKSLTGIDGTEVFRWSPSMGRVVIGSIPEKFLNQTAFATEISDDGNTIVGYANSEALAFKALGGFVWTAAGGAILMPGSSDGRLAGAVPTGVSADGSVIVGNAYETSNLPYGPWKKVPFRWTSSTGTYRLDFDGYVEGVSADGRTIVGYHSVIQDHGEAIRWTEQSGFETLGWFPSDWFGSHAKFASDDGSTIVGGSFPNPAKIGPVVARWIEGLGIQPMSTLGDDQHAVDMSADASVIVGSMRTLRTDVPTFATIHDEFVWTAEDGLRKLPELLAYLGLTNAGPLVDENKQQRIYDVSDDGRYLLGASIKEHRSTNLPYEIPTYTYEHWVIDMALAPEPTTFVLMALFLPFLSARRHRARIGASSDRV